MFQKPVCVSKIYDNEILLLRLLMGVESEQDGQFHPSEKSCEPSGSLKAQPIDERKKSRLVARTPLNDSRIIHFQDRLENIPSTNDIF